MRGQIARDPDHSVQIQSGSMDPLAAYSGSADPLAAYFMHFPFCASPHMVVPYIIYMAHRADYQRTDEVWSDLVRLGATAKLLILKTGVDF